MCDTASKESTMMAVARLKVNRDKTAWIATYMAGTLSVTNLICVMRSRLAFGFKGASLSKTGRSTSATLSTGWELCGTTSQELSRWPSCVTKRTEARRPISPRTCRHVEHLGQDLRGALLVGLDRHVQTGELFQKSQESNHLGVLTC